MKSGIYLILNNINNNLYIGSAVDIFGRWSKHIGDLRRGRHYNSHLQAAWNKYGEQNFSFDALEPVEAQHLIEREQYYIDMLKPEYNMRPIAESPLGTHLSEETRKKIGDANRRRVWTEASKEKMRLASTGRKFSDEVKLKLSNSRKGKAQSPEHIKNRTSTQVGKTRSEESKKRMSEAQKRRWNK